MKTTPSNSIVRLVFLTAFCGALIAPIMMYVQVFGLQISADHARWAEFGSAMAGIYSPILTIATIAILALQFKLQNDSHIHVTDADYINQARADIEFYLQRLSDELTRTSRISKGFEFTLLARFQLEAQEDFDKIEVRDAARNMNRNNPRVFALHCALQSIFAGLSSSTKPMYRMNRESAVQKMIALLSFELCVALENYHRVVCEGRLKGPYLFSPLLAKA